MNKRRYIVLACDCDPDRQQYGGYPYTQKRLAWKGVSEAIPRLVESIKPVEDHMGERIHFTWNIRSDAQIKLLNGASDWVIDNFYHLWTKLSENHDCLAWHPHLWKWDDRDLNWYQEVGDKGWVEDCLYDGFDAMKGIIDGEMFTMAGWDYQNNITLSILSRLGVTADYSALPGMKSDGYRDGKSHLTNLFDWSITSHDPYYPSKQDYRRPGNEGEPVFDILEIPKFTFLNRFLAPLISIIRNPKMAKDFVLGNQKYNMRLSPTVNPALFIAAINAFAKSERRFMIIYFHCDEILADKTWMRSMNNLIQNIYLMKRKIRDSEFITIKELYNKLVLNHHLCI